MAVVTEQAKHYAAISKKYHEQPTNEKMGILTNYMKYDARIERMTIKKLLDKLSNGHNAIISNYELDHNHSIRFVSSSLIMIDVDDDEEVTDPKQVLNDLKDYCTGLFYTWSHGIKGIDTG